MKKNRKRTDYVLKAEKPKVITLNVHSMVLGTKDTMNKKEKKNGRN